MRSVFILFIAMLITAMEIHAAEQSVERYLSPPSDEGVTIVKVWFELHDINEINDEEESFGFNGVLRLTWKDQRQAFDPATTGVREKIYQGAFQVDELSPAWFPQVYLSNESGEFNTNAVSLRISPDGTSVLTSSIDAMAETNLSMRKFPFDTQVLNADFKILGSHANEVQFFAEGAAFDPKLNLSQWELSDVAVLAETKKSPAFVLNFSVKRDPLFILRLVGLPLALIVMLSWSVFWMERSSLGDRISVSFVGILTAVAYQIVVGDLLPHVSYITVMHGFLNLSFLIMCASVVINLVVGGYERIGKPAQAHRIDRKCRWIFPLIYFGLLTLLFFLTCFYF